MHHEGTQKPPLQDEHTVLKLSCGSCKHAVAFKLQVGRVGQKKKARMARTRSDFLTRAPMRSVGGDSDEDDHESGSSPSPRHYTLPLTSQSSMDTGIGESCFSDSDMVTGAEAAVASLSLLTPPQRESTDLNLTSGSDFWFLKKQQETFQTCSKTNGA